MQPTVQEQFTVANQHGEKYPAILTEALCVGIGTRTFSWPGHEQHPMKLLLKGHGFFFLQQVVNL